MNIKLRDVKIIDFALFSTYLGVGNLMFPPILGLQSGEGWLPSVFGLAASGILMPILGIKVIAYAEGSVEIKERKLISSSQSQLFHIASFFRFIVANLSPTYFVTWARPL